MIRVGIAGYMGSGKSTFAHWFSQKGGAVFDADQIAKGTMNKSPDIKTKLAKEFGQTVLTNNEIQFPVLGKRCFSSQSKLVSLNTIVHPELIEHLRDLLQNTKHKVGILDAALIPLWHIENWFDILFWIQASKETRLKRLSQKVTIPLAELQKRMNLQEALFKEPSEKEWTILTNEGSVDEFNGTMRESYQELEKLLAT